MFIYSGKEEKIMSRGRRYDNEPKLNIKKVLAFIIAIAVVLMFFVSIKNLLTKEKKNQDVSVETTYFSIMENNKWGVIDNLRTIYNKT